MIKLQSYMLFLDRKCQNCFMTEKKCLAIEYISNYFFLFCINASNYLALDSEVTFQQIGVFQNI